MTYTRIRFGILIAGLVFAFLPLRINAINCSIIAVATEKVDAVVQFSLICDSTLDSRVAWELGDGTSLDFGNKLLITHRFQKKGSYTIFARIEGEVIPASKSISILNPTTSNRAPNSSPILIDEKRNRIWNVNQDNNSVTVVSTQTLKKIKEINVGRFPRSIAQDSQGNIWVTNQNDATLSIIDGETMVSIKTLALPYASRPFGICANPAGTILIVTLEATGMVLKINTSTQKIVESLKIFPTPRGIAIDAAGKNIYISRYLSAKEKDKDNGEVGHLGMAPLQLLNILPIAYDENIDTKSNGHGVPNAISSLAISPDGTRLWVPFKKDNVRRGLFLNPSGPAPDFESIVRAGLAQLYLPFDANMDLIEDRFDLDNRSLASAVAFSKSGVYAFIATETSNEIAIYNTLESTRITAIEPLDTEKERGPNGLVLLQNDSLLFIHYFLSREIGIYDITHVGESNLLPLVVLVPTVEKEMLRPDVFRGKKLFYNAADPRMSTDKYLSCAACHHEGGSDGRVWDFTHKGEGLRRTPILNGKVGVGPFHWTANFDEIQDFEADIRGSFSGKGFMDSSLYFNGAFMQPLGGHKAGVSPELDDLTAYIKSLNQPHASPFRNQDGSLTLDAKEGEKIFHRDEVGCAKCHVPPYYSNSILEPTNKPYFSDSLNVNTIEGFLLHNVGTLKLSSGKRLGKPLQGLDTPSLLGLWENSSFLHDGSASTLRDVITTQNLQNRHGNTSQLSVQEKDQLLAFLNQIDGGPTPLSNSIPHAIKNEAQKFSFYVTRLSQGFSIKISGGDISPVVEIYSLQGKVVRTLYRIGKKAIPDANVSFFWDGMGENGLPGRDALYVLRAELKGKKLVHVLVNSVP